MQSSAEEQDGRMSRPRDEGAEAEEGREAKRQRCGETGKQQGLRKQVHDINKLDIPTEEKSRRIQVSIVTLTEDAMLN